MHHVCLVSIQRQSIVTPGQTLLPPFLCPFPLLPCSCHLYQHILVHSNTDFILLKIRTARWFAAIFLPESELFFLVFGCGLCLVQSLGGNPHCCEVSFTPQHGWQLTKAGAHCTGSVTGWRVSIPGGSVAFFQATPLSLFLLGCLAGL